MPPASTRHSTTNPPSASRTASPFVAATAPPAAPTPLRIAAEKTEEPHRAKGAKQRTCPVTLTRTPNHPSPRQTTTWPLADATHLQGQQPGPSLATTAPPMGQGRQLQQLRRDARMMGNAIYPFLNTCAPCVLVSSKIDEIIRRMLCHLCHSTTKHLTNRYLRANRYTTKLRHLCHYRQIRETHTTLKYAPKNPKVAHLLFVRFTRAHTRTRPDLANPWPPRPLVLP